ncbi:hypothetical protein [Helicobacter typhlonius]
MKKIHKMAYITKTSCKFLGILIIIACVGGAIALMQSVASLASFEVGFVGFSLIVGGSFITLLKRLKNQDSTKDNDRKESKKQESKEQETQEAQEKMPSFSTRFVIGAQISLSFLRLVSYVLFALMLIALFEYQLFALSAFFVGLCIAVVVFVGLGLWSIRQAKVQ